MKYATLTILVPIKDLEIEASVDFEEESEYSPAGYDVTVNNIEIKGCDYEVVCWEDEEIDEKAVEDWRQDNG